jgi:macrolide-specific efflux system membrane fusion protein
LRTIMSLLKSRAARYAAGLIVVLGLVAGIKHLAFPSSARPRYLTATVKRGDIEQTVLASGILTPSELVSVGAQVSGQVKALNVQLGERLTRGQLIALIDPVPQENTLRNAEALLAQEQAQLVAERVALRQDELSLKRQTEMLAVQGISQADYDAAQAAVDTARANIAALEAQITQAGIAVDTARVNLGYTKISSPIDGEVIAVLVKQGQTVNSVYSTPTIVKVAKLDTMTVKAQISEADVIKVAPGQKVYFTILGDSSHRYYARLRAIEPATEAFASDTSPTGTGTSSSASTSSNPAVYYNALFDVDNPDHRLRASMTVQVNVVLAEVRQALLVPSSALGAEGDAAAGAEAAADTPADSAQATLRVLDAAGEAQPRRVRVGINNNINAQILEGLSAGEKVVISSAATPDSATAAARK